MGRFEGTVALISGGARGMGESHARALVAEGAKVVMGDVLDEEGADAAADIGDSARYIHLDVTSEDDWSAAVALAESEFGPVNLLINNAGIVVFGPTGVGSIAEFRKIIDVNLVGTYLGMHLTAPSLRKAGGGVIINVSSSAGLVGNASVPGYVASKWGVRGMTKSAALDLARDNVRVMSLHPGAIRSAMTAQIPEEITTDNAIPRFGEQEEITKMVLFMAADATFSTGCEFVADGGEILPPVIDLPDDLGQ